MAMISEANFKTLVDKIAKIYTLLNAALGDGSAATMASEHAVDIRNTIRDIGDHDQILDLLRGADDLCDRLLTSYSAHGLVKPMIIKLEKHCGGINSFTDLGTTFRLPQEFALLARKLQVSLTAANVFPVPFGDGTEMGLFAVTGAGAGTFTDGSPVDTTLYGAYGDINGKAVTDALELEVINQQIQAQDIVVTVTYVDQDGNTAEACSTTSTIPNGSAVGFKVDVSLNAGDWGARDVTAISITGGTNGDDFRVQGKRERALPS